MPDLTSPAVERVVATFPIGELGSDLSATGATIETSVTADAVKVQDQKHKFPKIVVEERK